MNEKKTQKDLNACINISFSDARAVEKDLDSWVTYLTYVIWGICVFVLVYVSIYIVRIRKLKRKWKIPALVIPIATLALIIPSLMIVPLAFGNSFLSSRFEPDLVGYEMSIHQHMRVECVDGRTFNVSYVGVRFWWSNSYFVPVQIHYNGFDYVMLVYNSTVDNPGDVTENKDHLVWGAWKARRELNELYGGWNPTATASFASKRAYDFYLNHKALTNYTRTIHPGKVYWDTAFRRPDFGAPAWYGQDLRGNPISLGSYYVYFILYGMVAEPGPFELKVLNGYWKD